MKNVTKQECLAFGFQQNLELNSLYEYKLDNNGRSLRLWFDDNSNKLLSIEGSHALVELKLTEFMRNKPHTFDSLKEFVETFNDLSS